ADDEKGISVILLYTALLFFLLGVAARMKMNFHHRMEISTADSWSPRYWRRSESCSFFFPCASGGVRSGSAPARPQPAHCRSWRETALIEFAGTIALAELKLQPRQCRPAAMP